MTVASKTKSYQKMPVSKNWPCGILGTQDFELVKLHLLLLGPSLLILDLLQCRNAVHSGGNLSPQLRTSDRGKDFHSLSMSLHSITSKLPALPVCHAFCCLKPRVTPLFSLPLTLFSFRNINHGRDKPH